MIGYKVIPRGYDAKGKLIYSPKRTYWWYEGKAATSRKIQGKVAEQIGKAVANKVVSFAAGGPVTGLVTVASAVSKPLSGLGEGVGLHLAEGLTKIATLRSKNALNLIKLRVAIKGDFDAAYKIDKWNDWGKLAILVASLQNVETDEPIGESVAETVIWAHRNFLLDLYGQQGNFNLEITVKL